MQNAISISIAIIFTWCGFIGAISIMESWLKFRLPGLTLPAGLSMGKLVFSTFNVMEIAFAYIVLISLLIIPGIIYFTPMGSFLAAILILLIQTLWILPALNKRAQKIIIGHTLQKSKLHYWHAGCKLVILTAFIITGISLFNKL